MQFGPEAANPGARQGTHDHANGSADDADHAASDSTDQPTLGSITTQAKLAAATQGVDQELIETYALFGDPAMGLEVDVRYRVYLPLLTR